MIEMRNAKMTKAEQNANLAKIINEELEAEYDNFIISVCNAAVESAESHEKAVLHISEILNVDKEEASEIVDIIRGENGKSKEV